MPGTSYRLLNDNEYTRWDEFVDCSPQGSIYAKSFYLNAVGYPFKIGVCESNGDILAGIVLAKNEAGVYANPLFAKYLGILYSGELYGSKRFRSRADESDREIIAHLPKHPPWLYTFHPAFDNWLNFYWSGYRQTTHYTYRVSLNGASCFRDAYDSMRTRNIKKALRQNLAVEAVDAATFARVNRKTYEAQGTKPPYSDERLVRFHEALEQHDCLYARCIKDDAGNIHSVAAVVYDRRCANLILNGTDPHFKQSAANPLLIDHMIDFASGRCEVFDFEGSMHQRIERFYRGFGGRLTPYFVIRAGNLATRLYSGALALYKRWR